MIYTARGPIHKSELGITLGHEHIKWESDECHANNMYFNKKYQEEDIQLAFTAISWRQKLSLKSFRYWTQRMQTIINFFGRILIKKLIRKL